MAGLPTGVPSNVRVVPIDFNRQSFEEELSKAGYDKAKKTFLFGKESPNIFRKKR
jgi:O-methyltransferase involved in polyketide biosynthesis